MTYRLSPLAEQDLDAIWLHVAESGSENAANQVVDAIVERLGMLARYPRLGKLRPDLGDDLRSLPVNLYIVYYREAHQAIQIARVLHASRDQAVSLDETSTEP